MAPRRPAAGCGSMLGRLQGAGLEPIPPGLLRALPLAIAVDLSLPG